MWLPFRFAISYRDVQEIMDVRGVIVTYEAIREWSLKFGQTYANELRRRRLIHIASRKNLTLRCRHLVG